MSAAKSHLTPAEIFGQRVREARERRGWSQGELANRVGLERTTINKIERGSRADVAISQLFNFAEALGIAPVHLLTPRHDDVDVQLTIGGRVLAPAEARQWIRGAPPVTEDPAEFTEWFLDLPRSEQQALVERWMLARLASSPSISPLVAAAAGHDLAGEIPAQAEAVLVEWLTGIEAPRKHKRNEATDG